MVLILAKALNADLLTEFWIDSETFDRSEAPGKIFTLASKDLKIEALRYFRAQFNFISRTRKIIRDGNYDLVVFSGNNCLLSSLHLKKNQKYFLYCHAPVRHVFDLFEKRRNEEKNLIKRIIYYDIGAWGIRMIYWLGLSRFKKIIVNSKNVQNRMKKYCHRHSQVIYPPIDTNKFKWLGQKDYYLSFARVDDLKRVTDIVKAFQKMPHKKLLVASGGDELENIKKLAAGFGNIKVLGWVSDKRLVQLVGECIASIYIPIDEDFGMTPLESMSASKPCIGVFEGGLKETIIDEVNGKFIPASYTLDDLIKAVEWLTAERAAAMREFCQKQAAKFSQERFISEIKNVINYLK